MRRSRPPLLLLGSIALLLAALPARAASQALDAEWCLPIDDAYWVVGGPGSTCASSATPVRVATTLQAGEARLLVGRLDAASSTSLSLLQIALTTCGRDAGVTTSQNNLGRDDTPAAVSAVRYLFVATTSGEHTCSLSGRSRNVSGASSPVVRIAAGGRTYLEMAEDPKPGAARWGTPELQIGAAAPAGPEARVLETTFDASPEATAVEVIADAELTTCNARSNSCDLFGTTGSGEAVSGSVVDSRLDVVQLNESGAPCRTTLWPPGGNLRTRITNSLRHLKVFHAAIAPVDTSGGCAPRFQIGVRVRVVSGNILTVEDGRFSNGIAMNVTGATPPDAGAPAPPQGLAATPGTERVTLDWTDGLEPDLGAYLVHRTTDPPAAGTRAWTPIATTGISSSAYIDTGLANGTTYFYRLTATDRAGNESAPSAEVSETPRPLCPGFEADPRNQVIGSGVADRLRGTAGPDVICGLGGDDVIDGLGGDDVILGGSGGDRIVGGDGDDRLFGESGADVAYGTDGADVLEGGTGDDTLSGGAGADRIAGGDGADVAYGGADDDVIYGQKGADRLFGNAGDDRISAGDENDSVDGGSGDDRIWGGLGDDALFGTSGADVIYAGPGDDRLSGGGDADALVGGSGNDVLAGGAGTDRHYGQDGDDRLIARDGERDIVNGGPGEDDRASIDGRLDATSGVEVIFT